MWDDDNRGWDGMHDGGAWVGMGLTMLIASLLVVGLLVWIVVMLRDIRQAGITPPQVAAPSAPPPPPAPHPSPADEHLASRFARGEIDADEFERRVEVLRHARLDRR